MLLKSALGLRSCIGGLAIKGLSIVEDSNIQQSSRQFIRFLSISNSRLDESPIARLNDSIARQQSLDVAHSRLTRGALDDYPRSLSRLGLSQDQQLGLKSVEDVFPLPVEKDQYSIRVKGYFLEIPSAGDELPVTSFSQRVPGCTVALEHDDHSILVISDGEKNKDTEASGAVAFVFHFGSVVFLNARPEQEEQFLRLLQNGPAARQAKAAGTPPPAAGAGAGAASGVLEQEDAFNVLLSPRAPAFFEKSLDQYVVQRLDASAMELLARGVAQSMALSFYTSKADALLAALRDVLRAARSGNATPSLFSRMFQRNTKTLRSTSLMHLLCDSSILYVNVIDQLGLLDTSETAWRSDRYDAVWSQVREDFELEERLEKLQKKIVPIQDLSQFLLDTKKGQASEDYELIIIGLILIEVLLGLAHTATGEAVVVGAWDAAARLLSSSN